MLTDHSEQANSAENMLKARIARQFSRAASHYDQAAQIQAEIAHDAMALLGPHYASLLDIGCGTGRSSGQLRAMSDQLLAMDLAEGMLVHARNQSALQGGLPIHWLRGDAENLPLASTSLNGVYSSMVLQWCENIPKICSEIFRVLQPGGHGVLAIMCEGSMDELQSCWQTLDNQRHVNQFANHQLWQRRALEAGFEVQCRQKSYITWHKNVRDLLGSIKQIGANVVTATGNHAPLNRQSLAELEAHYQGKYARNGRLPLTYQICFIQLRK